MIMNMATFEHKLKSMKKFIVVSLLVMLAACTTAPKDGFVISGSLKGEVADSTQVFLRKTDSLRQPVEVDTTLIIDGEFEFTGKAGLPEVHYLFFDGIAGNAPLIVENGSIRFKAQKDSLGFSEIGGTSQNETFNTYLFDKREMSQMAQSMSQDLRNAQTQGDQATIEALREEYFELQEKAKNYDIDFVKNNPSSLIASIMLEQIAYQKAIPMTEVDSILKAMTPEMQKTPSAKRLKKMIENSKATEVGVKAPDFSGPSPDGSTIALNDIKGKVTLIDFWAAWCRPCRMENPNVVAVYNKYKDKGLSVIGVSLDRKKDDWIKAIADDGLEWNHVSNVKYFQDPIAKLYSVNAIPAAFLLDENGVIVAKNLRGPALEEKVAELLN